MDRNKARKLGSEGILKEYKKGNINESEVTYYLNYLKEEENLICRPRNDGTSCTWTTQDKKGNKIRHDCRYCMISEMYDD